MVNLLVAVLIIGYIGIATEHIIRINKAAIALVTGVLCWVIYIAFGPDNTAVVHQLSMHLGELSGILFFLLGAMTIVELIDLYNGFDIITRRITQTDKRRLLWIISFLTFFLSPVLDNLTTTIVMISLVRKLIRDRRERLYFAGMIVIASNAGGAWSPIGDVTTTMLWIGGRITSGHIIFQLFLPSLVFMLVPLLILTFQLKGRVERAASAQSGIGVVTNHVPEGTQRLVFFSGVIILLLVPVFKTLTHLPPYMGILGGLGILWIITEFMHAKNKEEEKQALSVAQALMKIDTPSILFFLGILLSVAALQASGVLTTLAELMDGQLKDAHVIAFCFGLLSSVIDNVPLVAAAQGMYSLERFAADHSFWVLLAYCTGTGGSILIIGSAAGVAAMGMERIRFFWYLRKFALPALGGYLAGFLIFLLQHRAW